MPQILQQIKNSNPPFRYQYFTTKFCHPHSMCVSTYNSVYLVVILLLICLSVLYVYLNIYKYLSGCIVFFSSLMSKFILISLSFKLNQNHMSKTIKEIILSRIFFQFRNYQILKSPNCKEIFAVCFLSLS